MSRRIHVSNNFALKCFGNFKNCTVPIEPEVKMELQRFLSEN